MHARIITTQGQFLTYHGDDSGRLMAKIRDGEPIYCYATPSRGEVDHVLIVRLNYAQVVAIEEIPDDERS